MGTPQTFKSTSIHDWAQSDSYHNSYLIPDDPILQAAKQNSIVNNLPDIAVSESQGKFLNLLARSLGARRILEVGALGGCVTFQIKNPCFKFTKLLTRIGETDIPQYA